MYCRLGAMEEPEIFQTLRNEFNAYARDRKRWISFADELGGDLFQTKLISNNPYDTPIFGSPMARAISRVSGEEIPPINQTRPAQKTVADAFDAVINNTVDLTFHTVQLESVSLTKSHLLELRGTVKVKNFTLEKEVTIHLSTDDWVTFEDYKAHYIPSLHEPQQDTFAFLIGLSPVNCESIQFCVRAQVGPNKQPFWDNNNGQNYEFNLDSLQPKPKVICPKIVTADSNNFTPKTWDIRRW